MRGVHPERVAAVFIAVMVLGTAGWLSTRPQRELAPPRTTISIVGRARDEGGVPARDASVQLFANAPAWLDGERGCDVSLLACDALDAGLEVLRRLDDGTLEYPEPLAVTRTDADGRFSLPSVARADLFVVVSTGEREWRERVDGGVLKLEFEGPGSVRLVGARGGRVVFINPFTRTPAARNVHSLVPHRPELVPQVVMQRPDAVGARAWATALVDGGASSVLVPASRRSDLVLGEPRDATLRLLFEDGGVVPDGPARLTCDAHLPRETTTREGVAHFGDVLGACTLVVGEARVRVRDEREVRLPGARLEVDVAGVDGGEVEARELLTLDPPRKASLLRGHAVLSLDPGHWALTVRSRGFRSVKQGVTLEAGVTRLALALEPAKRLRGLVRDGAWRGLPGVRVVGGGDEATTDAEGRFELAVGEDQATLEVNDVRYGRLTREVTDLAAPITLDLKPTRRLTVVAPGASEVRVDDTALPTLSRREWWFADPPRKRVVVVATAPGMAAVRRSVDLAERDEVSVRLAIPPATVLEGTVLSAGAPVGGLRVTLDDAGDTELPGLSVRTNAQGRFRFEDLEPGLHHLAVPAELGNRVYDFELTSPALDARVELPD